jgi:predicted nucleic-acid-binding Zn-ribbon protein
MHKTTECPRCGTPNLYQKDAGLTTMKGGLLYVEIGKLFRHVHLDVYVCAHCGHLAVALPAQNMDDVRQALAKKGWTLAGSSPRSAEGQLLPRYSANHHAAAHDQGAAKEDSMALDPGICAMCGATEVYWKHSGILSNRSSIYLKTGLFGFVDLDVYICMACGYIALRVPAVNVREVGATMEKQGWKRIKPQAESDS